MPPSDQGRAAAPSDLTLACHRPRGPLAHGVTDDDRDWLTDARFESNERAVQVIRHYLRLDRDDLPHTEYQKFVSALNHLAEEPPAEISRLGVRLGIDDASCAPRTRGASAARRVS